MIDNVIRISARLRGLVFSALCCLFLAGVLAAQPHVTERLQNSPRHHEWVRVKAKDVKTEGAERTVHCFVTYPEVAEKAPVVIVIHENRGLNDWARSVTDHLAEAGYIAIAPDLLSGAAPEGGKTSDFADPDAARTAIYALDADQVTADLNAVADYAKSIPAANGTVAVSGFCWGGGQSFRFATNRADLAAAFVFYGSFDQTAEAIARINCPVYGFYGGNDSRINATIPESARLMAAAGKTYEPVIYEGAGHGFFRAGEDPEAGEANKTGREQAWERWKKLLDGMGKKAAEPE